MSSFENSKLLLLDIIYSCGLYSLYEDKRIPSSICNLMYPMLEKILLNVNNLQSMLNE